MITRCIAALVWSLVPRGVQEVRFCLFAISS